MVDAELSQGKPQLKGLSTIIGGFICNLVSGNLNNWGTISPYITSYLHA